MAIFAHFPVIAPLSQAASPEIIPALQMLSPDEKSRLRELELTVERNLTGFIAAGRALLQFVSGSDRRQVEKSIAITVIRRVMTHLVGEQRTKTIPIEYESDLVTLEDIYGLLEIAYRQ
jgi:hypothetical protein